MIAAAQIRRPELARMSAMGQKQTCALIQATSALPPKADTR